MKYAVQMGSGAMIYMPIGSIWLRIGTGGGLM
jgi:hypothetical protein